MDRRLARAVLVLFALLAAAEVGSAIAAPVRVSKVSPESAQFQALPLERSRQNHLLVRAEINGKPALLGVDTGAPVSAIAASRREHFGLTALPDASKLPERLMINGG